jgi:hypothetical protein
MIKTIYDILGEHSNNDPDELKRIKEAFKNAGWYYNHKTDEISLHYITDAELKQSARRYKLKNLNEK